MKNAVFWDVSPCRSCELNPRSSETSDQYTISTRHHILEDGILHLSLQCSLNEKDLLICAGCPHIASSVLATGLPVSFLLFPCGDTKYAVL
jgi:hypothetical protein